MFMCVVSSVEYMTIWHHVIIVVDFFRSSSVFSANMCNANSFKQMKETPEEEEDEEQIEFIQFKRNKIRWPN